MPASRTDKADDDDDIPIFARPVPASTTGKADDDDDIPIIQGAKRPEPAAKAASDSSRESESHGSESDDSDDLPLCELGRKRGRPSDSCGGSESDGSAWQSQMNQPCYLIRLRKEKRGVLTSVMTFIMYCIQARTVKGLGS